MKLNNMKMKTVIITIFTITVTLGIALLCILSQVNSNAILKEKINDNMSTYLDAQVKAVERFVENSEKALVLFSKSAAVSDLIQDDTADRKANPGRELSEFTDDPSSDNIQSYSSYTHHRSFRDRR